MGRDWVCLVEGEHGTIDPAMLNCGNQSHAHISRDDAESRVSAGKVEWIKQPVTRRDKGVVRILKDKPRFRGLSARFGETLAIAVQNQELWARVMLSDACPK